MKSAFASVAAIALLAGVLAQDDLVLNTPNPPTQCVNTQITWTGGQPPFFLSITPGGLPTAPALEQFPNLTSSPFVWNTNIQAGTSVGFSIVDNTGTQKQTAPVTIQAGPLSGCLTSTQAGQTSGAATSTGVSTGATTTGSDTSSTSSASTPGASSTSPSTSGSSTSSSSSSSTSSSGSPSPSTTGNSALANYAPMGVAGFVGAVIAAVLA